MSESGVAVESHIGKTCRHCNEPIVGSALTVFRYRSSPAAVEIIHFHRPCIENLLISPSGIMTKVVGASTRSTCPQCGLKGGDVTFVNGSNKYGNYHTDCIRTAINRGNWTTDPKYEYFIRTIKNGSFEEKKKFFKEKRVGYIDRITNSLTPEELKSYLEVNPAAKKRVEEALKLGVATNLEAYVRGNWNQCSERVKLSFLRQTKDLEFYNRIKQGMFYPPTKESLQQLYDLTFGRSLADTFREDYGYLVDTALRTGTIKIDYILTCPQFYFTTTELMFFGVKYFPQIEAELDLIEEKILANIIGHSDFHILPEPIQDKLNEALFLSKEGERILSKSF